MLNLTHGFGPGSAGEFITTHPDIDGITFTGESATGAAIMRAVAPGVKPVSFELGGKNAALVFADADFEAAVDGTARSVFANCGQVCLCTERVYVEHPIYERFVAALAERARALRVGWPGDPQTDMGPLVSREHRDKVLAYFALAREETPPSSPAAAYPRSATPATPAPTWNRPSGPACPKARAASRRKCSARSATWRRSTPRKKPSAWPTTAATAWPPPSGPRT